MHITNLLRFATIGLLAVPLASNATYVHLQAPAVQIASIYENEDDYPFIIFATPVDADCTNNGMILMHPDRIQGSLNQKYKMTIALAAQTAGLRVIVDYFKDVSLPVGSWYRCYVSGIQTVN